MNKFVALTFMFLLFLSEQIHAKATCSIGTLAGTYLMGQGAGYPTNTLVVAATEKEREYDVELISLWSCKPNDDGSCTNVGQSKGRIRFSNCTGIAVDDNYPECRTTLKVLGSRTIKVKQSGQCGNGFNVYPDGGYEKK